MAVKTYTLSFAQQVARPLLEVFDFFSRAENLEAHSAVVKLQDP
jgi:hypothetical protein